MTDSVTLTLRTARENVERNLASLAEPALRADPWGGLGMLHHAQDRLAEAAQSYRRALGENDALHWHYLRGVVLADQRVIDAAIVEFRRALALAEEGHVLASYRLGLALLAAGDYEIAVDTLHAALAQTPESAAILTTLADAEIGKGDWHPARRHLERAAELEPSGHWALPGRDR